MSENRPEDRPDDLPDDLTDLGDIEIPDDLSGLDDAASPQEPTITLLVTQVAEAKPLAAACSLAGLDVDVVPSPIGALAVLRSAPRAAVATEAAAALSRLLPMAPVLLLDRRGGRIAASRWNGGEHEDDLAAGLVLSGAPPELEDLLLGTRTVDQVPGVVTSVGMSRWTAMRALSAGRRKRGKD
ncbi:hypothetical protein [Cellulomonas taurus]|uniref:hypothetical protein n=1 Tax=Cellulomonas taurus TaxID=2729175 RepID=UPI001FE481A1|nr:hypothetical protein [Cellulomonas taurus]